MNGRTTRVVRLLQSILHGTLLIVIVAVGGCGTAAPTDNQGDNGTIPGSGVDPDAVSRAANLDVWLAAVSGQQDSEEPPPVVYTSSLIEQAYRAGQIGLDEYFTLRLTAMYDHEHLDDRFRGQQDTTTSATSLLRELANVYDDLSVETQAELRPYTLSFEDPESFAYDPDQPRIADVMAAQSRLRRMAMDRPADDGSYFVITGGTEAQREQVRDALNLSYDAFLYLGFTEPTDWIPVAIQADLGNPSVAGDETFSVHEGQRRCHIRLRSDLAGDDLDGTVAHELFHCFQEYVEADPAVFEAPWVWDSSAVWAQEYVYPDTNTEHEYDRTHFSGVGRYFFDQGGVREYASYFYWFFLYQEDGKTGDVVHDLYVDIQERGTLEAITGRADFYEEFKRYALWNLNTPPHKFYEDAGDEPTRRPSGSGSIHHAAIANGETFFDSIEVNEGGTMYHVYSIDDRVNKLRFDLASLQKDESNQNGIQVVYRVDGAWSYEDVSYRDELVFCRGREAERVDGIIFIVSNGQLDRSASDSRIDAELRIETTETCPVTWHGFVECSWSASGVGDGRGDDLFVLGDYTSTGTTRVEEVFLFDPFDGRYYATEQTVSISSRYDWFFEHQVPTVDTSYIAWERRVEDKNATRTYIWEPPDGCPEDNCWGLPTRVTRSADGDADVYILNDELFQDVGEYVSVYSAYHIPGSLGELQGHVPEVRTLEEDHSITVRCPTESFELTMSPDGARLTGSYQSDTTTCRAEYVYE